MVKKFFLGSFSLALNVVIYALIILAAIRIVTFFFFFSYEVFGNTAVSEESTQVVPVQIPEGASTQEIAGILKQKKLIKYKEAFVLHVAISQYKGLIKPGTYELKPSMTMDEILEVICNMSSTGSSGNGN